MFAFCLSCINSFQPHFFRAIFDRSLSNYFELELIILLIRLILLFYFYTTFYSNIFGRAKISSAIIVSQFVRLKKEQKFYICLHLKYLNRFTFTVVLLSTFHAISFNLYCQHRSKGELEKKGIQTCLHQKFYGQHGEFSQKFSQGIELAKESIAKEFSQGIESMRVISNFSRIHRFLIEDKSDPVVGARR